MPADAVAGTTYARFRLSSAGGLLSDGLAPNGEVEDYQVQIIAAASLPVVTTQAVTDITQTTATGNGNVTSLGVPNPTQHGVVWSTSANPTTANSKTTDGAVSATGAFTSSITGLTAGTLYHVRAYATNTAGTAYGEDVTFTTAPGSFNKTGPANHSTGQPKSDLLLSWNASSGASYYEFCFSISTGCYSWINVGNVLSVPLTVPDYNTTYYWQVVARNAGGYALADGPTNADYWDFTTGTLPVVTTQAVTSIAQTTATGNGNVTSLGVPNPTQHGVVWGTAANPTTALTTKTAQGVVSSTGAFLSSITGLNAGTLYHVRAYATNAAGTVYGEDVTFTTAPGAFNKSAPTDGATNQSLSVNLTWGASTGVTSYSVCIETTNLCNGQQPVSLKTANYWQDVGNVTSYHPAGLINNQIYYWQVKAVNASGTTYANSQGTTWSFTTAALPTHTVTYANGGGTGTLPTQSPVSEGASFIVASGATLSRAGFTFNGWNDGSTNYAAGASYTMGTSNVTLTAQWTANPTHTVTYANGGGTGTLPTQSPVSEGASFIVASGATLSRAGFTFNGWNDGSTNYAAGASYTMGTSNVTLTAQWTANPTHTVTYANGGGTGTLPTQSPVSEGASFTVASGATLSRAGFTFNGWNDGSTNYAAGASYTMGTSNVTLTAQWLANGTHTVTYANGGGTGTLPTQSPVSEGASFIVASGATLSRAGFTFNGWNDGSTNYAAGASYTMGTSNVTLTAQWTANPTHTVTYANGGGTGTLPTQSPVSEGASFIVASGATLSRAGFTFNGWNDGSTNYAAGASYTMGTSNVTLTAQWTANPTHTVTYANGGGTGTLPTQSPVSEGASFIVASGATLSRAGFTFNGWNDGSTNYAAGASYTMGISNVTLTAQWTQNAVTHSITLVQGWNLVSFRVRPNSTAIADVLTSITGKYSLVYAWDVANAKWLKYDPAMPPELITLQNLDETMGVWIKITTTPATLQVSGLAPVSTSISLKGGSWNLVGYPSLSNLTPPAFSWTGTDPTLVYAYHAGEADLWKLFDSSAPEWSNDLAELAPGWGYWIKVGANHTWVVNY